MGYRAMLKRHAKTFYCSDCRGFRQKRADKCAGCGGKNIGLPNTLGNGSAGSRLLRRRWAKENRNPEHAKREKARRDRVHANAKAKQEAHIRRQSAAHARKLNRVAARKA